MSGAHLSLLTLFYLFPVALNLPALPAAARTTVALCGELAASGMSNRHCGRARARTTEQMIIYAYGCRRQQLLFLRGGCSRAPEISAVLWRASGPEAPASEIATAAVSADEQTEQRISAPGRRRRGTGAAGANVQSKGAITAGTAKRKGSALVCTAAKSASTAPAALGLSEPACSSSAAAGSAGASASPAQHVIKAAQALGGMQMAIINAAQPCRAWVIVDPLPVHSGGATASPHSHYRTTRESATAASSAQTCWAPKKKVGRPLGSSKRYTTVWEGVNNVYGEGLHEYDFASGLQPHKCLSQEGCSKRANYGSPVNKLPLFCGPHRRREDIDLRNRRCQVLCVCVCKRENTRISDSITHVDCAKPGGLCGNKTKNWTHAGVSGFSGIIYKQ